MHQTINKQVLLVLNNERRAFLLTVILALVPMMTWLSVALIALVTLRRGWRAGLILLIAGLSADLVVSSLFVTLSASVYHAFLEFMPCYLAAVVLRLFKTWRGVFWAFISFVTVVVGVLQLQNPAYIERIFKLMSVVMLSFESNTAYMQALLNDTEKLWPLANLFLGVQLASVLLSALVSLSLARSKQSELFYPGAFQNEMLSFRADKVGLLLFVVIAAGAYSANALALALLPSMVLYFTVAGLVVTYQLISVRRIKATILWLLIPLVLMPVVMIPVYLLFGSLDSLVNIRLLIPARGEK